MPESSHNATGASRQVGAVELTPRPAVAANVTSINDAAQAGRAPAMIGVHSRLRRSGVPRTSDAISTSRASRAIADRLAKPKEGENGHDDHDQADQIN